MQRNTRGTNANHWMKLKTSRGMDELVTWIEWPTFHMNNGQPTGNRLGREMELIERGENGENNASAEASRLHALYDPRHREPSYWYCLFNLIYFVWIILVLCYICLKYVYLLLAL